MIESAISLRKFIEVLNCINESTVYNIQITPLHITIYKYHEQLQSFTADKQGIIHCYNFLVSEMTEYLKEGGWIE